MGVIILIRLREWSLAGFGILYFATTPFVMAGWLLSLCSVFPIQGSTSRQRAMIGCIGSALGPLVLALLDLYEWMHHERFDGYAGVGEYTFAIAISLVSSRIYLMLLNKAFQRIQAN